LRLLRVGAGETPGVGVGEPKLINVVAASVSAHVPRVGEAVVLLNSRAAPDVPLPGAVEGPGADPEPLPLPLLEGRVFPAVVTRIVLAGVGVDAGVAGLGAMITIYVCVVV
jgi:hypothetical protein